MRTQFGPRTADPQRSEARTLLRLLPALLVVVLFSLPASAQVARVGSWTTGTTHTVGAGSDRLLVVMVGMEDGTNRTVTAVTYGGQSLTRATGVVAVSTNGFHGRSELWYLPEAGISAASGTTITATLSGLADDVHLAAATYTGVDQSSPIVAVSTAQTGTPTPNPISTSVSVLDGGMAVAAAFSGNTGTFTWGNGWTEGTDQNQASSSSSTADNAAAANGTDTASATHTGPNRLALSVISLSPCIDLDGDGLCAAEDLDDDGDGVLDADDPAPQDAFVCGDSDGDTCDDCAVLGSIDVTNDGTDTDGDGLCDAGDTDDDNDGILDGADPAPLDAFICGDSDGDTCDDCAVLGSSDAANDGTDTDGDGLCDAGDTDDDNDGIADGADPAPLNAFICGDSDGDTCDDCAVAATFAPANDGLDSDADGLCDAGDTDDDNDGVADGADPAPLDAFVCGDSDGDTCDDCAVAATFAPANDGADFDGDGLCDAGDADDDNDGVADGADPAPLDAFICGDSDGDTCDDCAVLGSSDAANDGLDSDGDGLCDAGDSDDDNDGILDGADPAPLNALICGDSDGDTCDDCAVAATFAPANDGLDTDGDGLCDAGDSDDDNDGILDGADPAPLNALICGDSDGDTCDDCAVAATFAPANDGLDTDGDGLCDAGDTDDDNDGVLDGADPAPLDAFICGDSDGDTCDDCAVAATFAPANDGADFDADGLCDAGDSDDDSDGILDGADPAPLNAFICGDSDGDTCDDCAVAATFAPANDGADFDGDGLCDAGDTDDDNDGIADGADPAPLNAFICGDSDGDTCDDCAVLGSSDAANDGLDTDADGLCDSGDPDDDNDGILDGADPAPLDAFICGDSDGDTCDDCAVLGSSDAANDGLDTDADGLCDAGDSDDDNDGILDGADPAPLDAFICGDSDGDTCDDCAVAATFAPANDGADFDGDGLCDAGDSDDDNDGILDGADPAPLDAFICGDSDGDTCDDCAVLGSSDAANDGLDTDADGLCDAGDSDDDNDGILDGADPAPLDAFICGDSDGDTCDDCTNGSFDPANDGPDADADGFCDAGDNDTDGDGVADTGDSDPLDPTVCQDSDGDGCDDCSTGTFAPANDGLDTDADGLCDSGDPDDDNDGILDGADPEPLNAFVCGDSDGDGCDDCSVLGSSDAANDGLDSDADGLCDAGDADDDNDGVLDGADPAPLDAFICGDSDGDTCDDCAVAATFAPGNDGLDSDADGLCDAGDADDDNDGVLDGADPAPLDAFICGDSDGDTCDDCAVAATFAPANDGLDSDADGLCDAGDTDDDNDGVLDGADPAPLDAFICGDSDGDTCDDCAVAATFAPANDGLDSDADGLCDAGDTDDDNDGVLDGADPAPLDAFICGDSDGDTCDDCAVAATFAPANDGLDSDADGLCDAGDADDDNDGVLDGADPAPLDAFICGDSDGDTCDDCAVAATFAPANDGLDSDADGLCDAGDADDDNDGVLDGADPAPLDAFICGDSDGDTCDDCTSGSFDLANDGPDADADGFCDAGDNDTDGDGVADTGDSDPLDPTVCQDSDGDGCDDCSTGTFAPANDGLDSDADGLCDFGDDDDDNDGVLDVDDLAPLDPNSCGDSDLDGCDDCSSGTFAPANDGLDSDADGLCDLGDDDDDNDGILDGSDPAPLDAFICGDSDGDTCDDCAVLGTSDAANDGTDTDSDGLCDAGDLDDDGDGVEDTADSQPLNPFSCSDVDADGCDDCSSGTFDPANDGPDADMDGICDTANPDLDGDGVPNADDSDPLDPTVCQDTDGDGCDDCSTGTFAPANDGLDTDSDGLCDLGDDDDDGDGVLDIDDLAPLDPNACGDSDLDGCDDCASGTFAPESDGLDTDSDGLCDAGDDDDDGDSVLDIDDPAPLDPAVCGDSDLDGCDDCTGGLFDPANDGVDSDGDGLCNLGDDDDDGDGVLDTSDLAPLNPNICGDSDLDGCDDCSSGMFDTLNDGLDTDADGICNLGDPDDDGDGTEDALDGCPLDPLKIEPGDCGCGFVDEDLDLDGVSDCIQDIVFARGDMNQDGQVNIADPIFLLNFLFQGGLIPPCADATDANDDGLIDVSDVVYFIAYSFTDGTEPPPPFLVCGLDPTADTLDCVEFGACP